MNSTTAEHSFGSTSQPAGFLQLFRIAEIHLLSLCPGTDSHESRRERPPCLISPSAIRLVFSPLLSSHATQPPAPSSSITAGLGILSLIFWSFQPFHQHVVPLFPSLATFLYTLEFWGCEFKLAKIMNLVFLQPVLPFPLISSPENDTLFSFTIPSSHYVPQNFSTVDHASQTSVT